MREQSQAARRRLHDPKFCTRWLVGRGLDIGAGDDPMNARAWPNVTAVDQWDLPQGDAQELAGVPAGAYDFVHSSHCLEHMVSPRAALWSWLRVVRSGGFVIVTIPDWTMYEHETWPSRFNDDHKWAFTLDASKVDFDQPGPKLIFVPKLIEPFTFEDKSAVLERLELQIQGYNPADDGDQTLGAAECSIEFVLRKR